MFNRGKAPLKAFAATSLILFAIGLGSTLAPSVASAGPPPPPSEPTASGTAYEVPIPGGGEFYGISCPVANFCTAVGYTYDDEEPIYATESAGVWGTPTEIDTADGGEFYSVSCVDPNDCTAVGADYDGSALYATETAGTWGPATDVPGDTSDASLNGVSCVDAQDCVAVGDDLDGYAITVDEIGGEWGYGSPAEAPPDSSLDGVACIPSEGCAAVGSAGGSGEVGWFAFGPYPYWEDYCFSCEEGTPMFAISCPTPESCTAVGEDGYGDSPSYATLTDGEWSDTSDIPSEYGGFFNGVSCTDATDCVAVGEDYYGDGDAIVSIESGGDWGPLSIAAAPNDSGFAGFEGVSCASGGQCTAVGWDDNGEPIVDVLTSPNAPSLPQPPASASATAGDGQATVTWTASANTGGATITSYTATASPGGESCTVAETSPQPVGGSCTVTGLTDGTSYTFTVTATNSAGTSGTGPPTDAVTPAGPPPAPTNVQAVAGTASAPSAQVSWTAPASDGGAAITSYVVTANQGGGTCTYLVQTPSANSCTVTSGLALGNSYTFTVAAVSGAGTGASSAPSSAISFQKVATTVTLMESASSVTRSQSVSFTAIVNTPPGTQAATGRVTFYDGSKALGTESLSGGSATFLTHLKKGNHTIVATYLGNATLSTSTSNSVAVTVHK
jgi:hypothetical protein